MPTPIPCHIIAGPLGIGKTTSILDYLARHAADERIAVIVNDFGQTGLDAEILGGTAEPSGRPVMIKNVPGGCLCCTSPLDLRNSLMEIGRLKTVTRVIIEPSGLAILSDLVRSAGALCRELGFELRPVIALLHPKRVGKAHYESLPFFTTLIDSADILVANRMDQCSEADYEGFLEWTSALRPRKRQILRTHHGKLPEAAFAAVGKTGAGNALAFRKLSPEPEPHRHSEYSGGWIDPAPSTISSGAMLEQMQQWTREGLEGAGFLRFKAILPTHEGWKLFEIAGGECYLRDIGSTAASKLDWVTDRPLGIEAIRRVIQACADTTPERS